MRSIGLALIALLCSACGDGDPKQGPQRNAKPLIMTSFAPLMWVAKALGGDAIEVTCALTPTQDPAHDAPPREAIARLQRANLILVNGAGYEQWLDGVSLPRSRVVVTTRGIDELIALNGLTHAHGDGSSHAHGKVDPHTWLDPVLLKSQAQATMLALMAALPTLDAPGAMARVSDQLDALHAAYGALPALPEGEVVVAAYPAYNYLARRYGWSMESMLWQPAVALTDADMADLKKKLGDRTARIIVWESTPSDENAKRLAKAGFANVVVRTGATLAANEDFLTVMNENVKRLKAAFTRD